MFSKAAFYYFISIPETFQRCFICDIKVCDPAYYFSLSGETNFHQKKSPTLS